LRWYTEVSVLSLGRFVLSTAMRIGSFPALRFQRV